MAKYKFSSSKTPYLLVFGIIFLLFTSCKKDNTSLSVSEIKLIKSVLVQQNTAWNEGNIPKFMEGYSKSDSLQFITKNGRTLGWDNVKNNYLKHYPSKKEMGNLIFSNLLVKKLGENLVQVYGNWQLNMDKVVGGNFSLILQKEKLGWKIIIDHTW